MPGEAKSTSLPIRWSDCYFWLMLGSQSTCPQHSLWDWNHALKNMCQQGQRSSSHWHGRGECADVPQWTRHLMGRFHLDTSHSGVRLDTELVVQLLSRVQLFATPWTAAHQASLSFAISWSLLKLMSIESVMPSKHLILCRPLLLLPSIFPSIRVFTIESVFQFFASGGQSIGASASASVLLMTIQAWFPLGWTGLTSLLSKGLSRVFYSISATSAPVPGPHGSQWALSARASFHSPKCWFWTPVLSWNPSVCEPLLLEKIEVCRSLQNSPSPGPPHCLPDPPDSRNGHSIGKWLEEPSALWTCPWGKKSQLSVPEVGPIPIASPVEDTAGAFLLQPCFQNSLYSEHSFIYTWLLLNYHPVLTCF